VKLIYFKRKNKRERREKDKKGKEEDVESWKALHNL
jgi:hypothetical protein